MLDFDENIDLDALFDSLQIAGAGNGRHENLKPLESTPLDQHAGEPVASLDDLDTSSLGFLFDQIPSDQS